MFHTIGYRFATAMTMMFVMAACGCGTTREHEATEQLVVSDAVDKSIQKLDFRPLSGRTVYLDSSYLRPVKGPGFVNAEYVISAMRQQILAAGCLMQDAATDAEIIIEARMGALGSDNHMVTYGIPENNALNSAARFIPNSPSLPSIPEISVAKREAREAAAKIAAFAYDRETRKPVWQSGVDHSLSTAKDTWVMGIGPFQGGSIREKTKLAGVRLRFGRGREKAPHLIPSEIAKSFERPAVDYTAQTSFSEGWPVVDNGTKPGVITSDSTVVTLPTVPESSEPQPLTDDPTPQWIADAGEQPTFN